MPKTQPQTWGLPQARHGALHVVLYSYGVTLLGTALLDLYLALAFGYDVMAAMARIITGAVVVSMVLGSSVCVWQTRHFFLLLWRGSETVAIDDRISARLRYAAVVAASFCTDYVGDACDNGHSAGLPRCVLLSSETRCKSDGRVP